MREVPQPAVEAAAQQMAVEVRMMLERGEDLQHLAMGDRTVAEPMLRAAVPHLHPSLSLSQIDWLEGAAELCDPADPTRKDDALRALAALRAELNKEDDGGR